MQDTFVNTENHNYLVNYQLNTFKIIKSCLVILHIIINKIIKEKGSCIKS